MDTVQSLSEKTVSSPYIRKHQRRHFLLLDLLPHAGAVFAIAGLWLIPFGWPEILSFLIMWAITGIGITVGYHRLFTHLAFKAKPKLEVCLAIAGSMAGQGGVISWACLHRRHHQLSDQEGDPHSPNLHGTQFWEQARGLLHSHLLWMRGHEYPNPGHYVRDLLKSKRIIFVNKHYYYWVLLGLLLPALFVGIIRQDFTGLLTGLLWGGAVRLLILGHTIWAINSFLHVFGSRPNQTTDNSRNAPMLGLLTFGEAFHNNHHAHPRSALFGLGLPALDPGYWVIWLARKLGWAESVYVPDNDLISKRKSTKDTSNS